ncbi:6,7-dimethyl-8-ribityllumazine synthase [Candidatus Gracilibacteria bacterium]|nr:6,7-dimethyl-8-ribityllumazine synthase [Candidatus Gracilibacteria bacterium]
MTKNGIKEGIKVNGEKTKIAIVLPYFNEELGLEIFKNTKEELLKNYVQEKNIKLFRCAGTLEIPFICKKIIEKHKPDAIIALGIVIRGETSHFDLVTQTTYDGLMSLQMTKNTPIIFGILACENEKQVKDRVLKNKLNKGKEYAMAALLQTNFK